MEREPRSRATAPSAAAPAVTAMAFGGVLIVMDTLIWRATHASLTLLAIALTSGGLLIGVGAWLRTFLLAQALLQRAIIAAQRGHLEPARQLLDEVEMRSKGSLVRHAVAAERVL